MDQYDLASLVSVNEQRRSFAMSELASRLKRRIVVSSKSHSQVMPFGSASKKIAIVRVDSAKCLLFRGERSKGDSHFGIFAVAAPFFFAHSFSDSHRRRSLERNPVWSHTDSEFKVAF